MPEAKLQALTEVHPPGGSIVYSPSSIINIFSNLIVAPEEKKIIAIKGVYFQKAGKNYNGIWYDELRD